MKWHHPRRYPVRPIAFRFLSIWMIAALLAGSFLVAQPAGIVSASPTQCSTTADGNWTDPAIWYCNDSTMVPTGTDSVTIVHSVNVAASDNVSVASLTIGNEFDPSHLTVNGTLTINGNLSIDQISTFDASMGTVNFGSGDQTIVGNSDILYF